MPPDPADAFGTGRRCVRRAGFLCMKIPSWRLVFSGRYFSYIRSNKCSFARKRTKTPGGCERPPEPPQTLWVRGTRVRCTCNAVPSRAVAARRVPPWNGRQGCGGLLRGKRPSEPPWRFPRSQARRRIRRPALFHCVSRRKHPQAQLCNRPARSLLRAHPRHPTASPQPRPSPCARALPTP